MDPQDKKSKDWSLFGKTEDRAIAAAKYKRGMGINPKAQTESSAEVSRSAKSMKNPTDRPYDVSTSPKTGLKKVNLREAAGTVTDPYEPKRKAAGTDVSAYEPKRKAAETYTKSYDVKPPKAKPAKVSSAIGEAPKAASDKSRVAPKMTSFQRMKARQFEKEGVAGRSMTRSAAQKKAMEKVGGLAGLFGSKSKTSSSNAAKKTDKEVPKKSAGKSKSELAAWYRSKRQGLAK